MHTYWEIVGAFSKSEMTVEGFEGLEGLIFPAAVAD